MCFTSIFQHKQYVEKLTVAVAFRGKKALSKKKLKRRQKVKSKVKSRTKVSHK